MLFSTHINILFAEKIGLTKNINFVVYMCEGAIYSLKNRLKT